MNATGHSCKVEDRKLAYLVDKIELKSQDAVKKNFLAQKWIQR